MPELKYNSCRIYSLNDSHFTKIDILCQNFSIHSIGQFDSKKLDFKGCHRDLKDFMLPIRL